MKYLERIKNYVDNTFTENEKQEFEGECLNNKELREELTFYLQAQQAVKETQADEWRAVYDDNKTSKGKIISLSPRHYIGIAASVLLIIFAVWQVPNLYTSYQLANQNNIINYLNLDRVITAGEEDTSITNNPNFVFGQAIDLVDKGNYQAAIDKIKHISENDEGYYKALEIRGICYYELKEYDKAKEIYIDYIEQANGFYKEQANWNLYLLYKNHPNPNNKELEEKEASRIWNQIKYNKALIE